MKILDFGIAKMQGNDVTKSGATLGTLAYMSPEQARGDKVDQRTDIWSLGAIMYELIAGKPLFQGTQVAVLNGIHNVEPQSLYGRGLGVSKQLESIIFKMLQKDMDRRFPNMEEFIKSVQLIHRSEDTRIDGRSQRTGDGA